MSLDISVLLFTYNCGQIIHPTSTVRDALRSVLDITAGNANTARLPDLIFLSLQELAPIHDIFLWGATDKYLTPFIDAVTYLHDGHGDSDDDNDYDNPVYDLVTAVSSGLTFGLLFSHASSVKISNLESTSVSYGYFQTGLKGAAGVRVSVSSSSSSSHTPVQATFVAAHLAANEGFKSVRDDNFKTIARKMAFSPSSRSVTQPQLLPGEDRQFLYKDNTYIFFLGDLNYRVALRRQSQSQAIPAEVGGKVPKWTRPRDGFVHDWLALDELTSSRTNDQAFFGFSEPDVTFEPTYKFSLKHKYSAKRIPSWCDRILYLGDGVNVLSYESIPQIRESDHIPVACLITIPTSTSPGRLRPDLVKSLEQNDIAADSFVTQLAQATTMARGGGSPTQQIDTTLRAKQILLQDAHIAARRGKLRYIEFAIGAFVYFFLTAMGRGILLAGIVGLFSFYMYLRTVWV
ncbi:Endonuclease/exonuclease/phosphatase [Lipomyces japonicus]|uniref:Endonuclease/exonuclease/phosphatase n=1 Tax=Lipomyces japonicus TaxID=56871 RepID=UPI0034CD6ACD